MDEITYAQIQALVGELANIGHCLRADPHHIRAERVHAAARTLAAADRDVFEGKIADWAIALVDAVDTALAAEKTLTNE